MNKCYILHYDQSIVSKVTAVYFAIYIVYSESEPRRKETPYSREDKQVKARGRTDKLH